MLKVVWRQGSALRSDESVVKCDAPFAVCGRGMKLNILVEIYYYLYLKVCIMDGFWHQFWEGYREACNAKRMCSTNTEFSEKNIGKSWSS
jgi:hypothetical protein